MSEPPSQRLATRAASPTSLLIGINVALYVAMVLVGGKSDVLGISNSTLVLFGADYAPLVRQGQVHRLLASAFLHLNPLHLLLNVAALVSIGPVVERDYGRLRFVVLYLVSGIVGSLVSVILHLRHPVISAGASGAICGVMAAGAMHAHLDGESRSAERRTLVLWALATLAFGALIRADNAAHIGGLAAGAGLGLAFWRAKPMLDRSSWPSAILIVAVLAAFGASIALRSRAETAPGLVNRGVDLAHADDHEGAIAAYRRALALEPNDAIAHYDLGLSLEHVGEYEQAIRHLARAYELEPSPDHKDALAGAHINHAASLFEKGDHQAAIAAYRRALEVDDTHAPAYANLGLALLATGDLDGAIKELRVALGIQPDAQATRQGLARALVQQGIELDRQSKRQEAIARYREALTLDANDWQAHYQLGLALGQEGDPNGAVVELDKAFALQPSEMVRVALASAIEARGDARADAGALGEALDDMGSATVLRLAPLDGGVSKTTAP